MTLPPPVPVTDDPDTAGFWAAAARGCIGVLFCTACDAPLHLPTPYCAACNSWDVEWRDVAPRGRVYSYTIAEQSIHPAFPAPYTIVLVVLDEVPSVRLVGHIAGRVELEIGAPLHAVFDEVREGVTIPRWLPSP